MADGNYIGQAGRIVVGPRYEYDIQYIFHVAVCDVIQTTGIYS